MVSPAKTCYVALDACDAGVARQFVADGDMPTLRELLAGSAVVETTAPVGFFVSSMWPTFTTATTASRHGYLCWDEIPAGTYHYRETNPLEIAGTPFWQRVSDAGRRVAILDVPHAPVVDGLHGVQVAEWGCHDRHLGTRSWPPELVDGLTALRALSG